MTRPDAPLGAAWLADGAVIAVDVIATQGSTPRPAGTRMIVCSTDIAGTIGGGHLELKAITAARAMISRGDLQPQELRFALGPSLGQCCGGSVTLRLAALDAQMLAGWPAATPLFRLQLHGAGHVGRAIATLLCTLDCEVDWFDQRDDGFAASTALGSPWPAHIRRSTVDTVEAEVAGAAPGAFFLVLTHEHALDLRIVERVLRRGDFAFAGLIGSKTKRAQFERRLAERGVAAEAIARLVCPIGVDGIDGKEPEVIAVAVVAQLLREAALRAKTGTAAAVSPASTDAARC